MGSEGSAALKFWYKFWEHVVMGCNLAIAGVTGAVGQEFLKFWEHVVMGCNLAIAGVTGAVGQEFLSILEERDFPFDSLKMLASIRSAGKKIEFKGKTYIVEELAKNSFSRVDIAPYSVPGRLVVKNLPRLRSRLVRL